MTTQKTFLYLNKLFIKVAFLLLIVIITSACLSTDSVTKKANIVEVVLIDATGSDGNLLDFGSTNIGDKNVHTKVFKLTNRSTLDVLVKFTIPEGFNRVGSGSNLGKECSIRPAMFVKGSDVCYFGIEFKPTIRLTHEDKAPLGIAVDVDGKIYNYNDIYILQGISKNSTTITFDNNINFGSTAKNSSKVRTAYLNNLTTQDIYYDIELPSTITIDPTSTCRTSGLLYTDSYCRMLFRYSSSSVTGDISETIKVVQDTGSADIIATMNVTNSTIANITAPAPRYDASMIISGTNQADGKLTLIGGRNEAGNGSTTSDIWTFDILKKTWTLEKKAPFAYTIPDPASGPDIPKNIDILYGNRVAVVNNKTLILPGSINSPPPFSYSSITRAGDMFDNLSFVLNNNNTVTRLNSATEDAKNNYKIATTLDKKVYIYGGNFKDGPITDTVSLVLDNGSFDNITITGTTPDRHLAGFASADNNLYLFGGSTLDNSTTVSKSLFKYTHADRKWVDIYDSSHEGATLTSQNNSAEMVSLKNINATENDNSSLYIFGGKFDSNASEEDKNTLYKFDLKENIWSSILNDVRPHSRTQHNLVQFMNKYIYLFGGINSANKPTNDLWVFDTTLNIWEKITQPILEQKLDHHAVTTSEDGRYIYIYGGKTADNVASTKFMRYDTELNEFKELASIGTPTGTEHNRFGHQLISAKNDSVILLLGGSENLGGAPTENNYQYDIKSNTWTALTPTGGGTADLKVADHTAVNKDGTIYVIGGRKVSLATGTAQDQIVTITFTDNNTATQPVATNINIPMATARFSHSATVVGDDIYVAGGYTNRSNKTDSVAKFDTTTKTWSNTPNNLVNPISDSSLVADGTTLYLIGGISSTGSNINTVYKSTGGNWALVTAGDTGVEEWVGKVMFSGQTYFLKANGAFVNFGGDVLSIIYP